MSAGPKPKAASAQAGAFSAQHGATSRLCSVSVKLVRTGERQTKAAVGCRARETFVLSDLLIRSDSAVSEPGISMSLRAPGSV